MAEGITGQQLAAPLILNWPAAAASFEYDGGPTKHVRFTAVNVGAGGNDIDIDGTADSDSGPAAVTVEGTEIHVSLATNGGFNPTTTAAQFVDLINNDPAASALVSASLVEGDGSGIIGNGDLDGGLSGGQTQASVTFPIQFASEQAPILIFQLDDPPNGRIIGTNVLSISQMWLAMDLNLGGSLANAGDIKLPPNGTITAYSADQEATVQLLKFDDGSVKIILGDPASAILHVLPAQDGDINFGDPTARWADMYAVNLHAGTNIFGEGPTGLNVSEGAATFSVADIFMHNPPDQDPHVVGQIWVDNDGFVKRSEG